MPLFVIFLFSDVVQLNIAFRCFLDEIRIVSKEIMEAIDDVEVVLHGIKHHVAVFCGKCARQWSHTIYKGCYGVAMAFQEFADVLVDCDSVGLVVENFASIQVGFGAVDDTRNFNTCLNDGPNPLAVLPSISPKKPSQ